MNGVAISESSTAVPDAWKPLWSQHQHTMRELTRAMIRDGRPDSEIGRALMEEFPGMLLTVGAEWRRGAVYANVIADERMRAYKQRRPLPFPARQLADPNVRPMSPGLIAFAEARGLVCAYCGQSGASDAGPGGLNWHRDAVPSGFQVDGRDLELCCSGCKTDGERYQLLGGAVGTF